MPIRPRPYTLVCEGCGWRKTVAPKSDALSPGEWFNACPKCGSKGLKLCKPKGIDGWLAEFFGRC
jgi:Zn finger protein HypA/HybF involved in hydrogenase expression